LRLRLLLTPVLASIAILEAGPAEANAEQARCEQISASTFLIEGETDEKMRDCVLSRFSAGTTELIVNSGGGNVEMAMDIADHVARPGLTVRVKARCYSSCANYLLPLARNLIVDPAATIVIHGGIDPLFIHSQHIGERPRRVKEMMKIKPHLSKAQVEAEFDQSVVKFRQLAERQKAFARKHNVGLGWFLYREPGDGEFGRYLLGSAGPKPHPFGWRLMLAEEPLVRSCLPNVQIAPFQRELEGNFINNPARYKVFRKAEGRRSLSLTCADPASRQ
jgi:hypothetical protein